MSTLVAVTSRVVVPSEAPPFRNAENVPVGELDIGMDQDVYVCLNHDVYRKKVWERLPDNAQPTFKLLLENPVVYRAVSLAKARPPSTTRPKAPVSFIGDLGKPSAYPLRGITTKAALSGVSEILDRSYADLPADVSVVLRRRKD